MSLTIKISSLTTITYDTIVYHYQCHNFMLTINGHDNLVPTITYSLDCLPPNKLLNNMRLFCEPEECNHGMLGPQAKFESPCASCDYILRTHTTNTNYVLLLW